MGNSGGHLGSYLLGRALIESIKGITKPKRK